LVQVGHQVGVELFLGRKLYRVVPAFPLGEITVDDGQGFAVNGEMAGNQAPLGVFAIGGVAFEDLFRLRA